MDDQARERYLWMARLFLIVGGIFLGLGLARAIWLPDILNGNPMPVALLLLAIGGGLWWTVRQAD